MFPIVYPVDMCDTFRSDFPVTNLTVVIQGNTHFSQCKVWICVRNERFDVILKV